MTQTSMVCGAFKTSFLVAAGGSLPPCVMTTSCTVVGPSEVAEAILQKARSTSVGYYDKSMIKGRRRRL